MYTRAEQTERKQNNSELPQTETPNVLLWRDSKCNKWGTGMYIKDETSPFVSIKRLHIYAHISKQSFFYIHEKMLMVIFGETQE